MRIHRDAQPGSGKGSQVLPALAPVLGLDEVVSSRLLARGVKSPGVFRVDGERCDYSMRLGRDEGNLSVVGALLHRGHASRIWIDQAPGFAAIRAAPEADAG